MVILWGVAILFAIISGVLLAGKGGSLIAGYNTSSQSHKARYDEKKLCRSMGIGMLVITIMLFVMAILGERVSGTMMIVFFVVIVVDIIYMMVWTNTKCYATDENGQRLVQDAKAMQDEKSNKKMTTIVSIIVAVIFVAVGILLMTGDIKITTTGSEIQIEASYYKDCAIAYNDITHVTYSEENVGGSRVNGFGSFKLAMGRFEDTKSYGRYTRYTYISGDACIIITTKNDDYYVINCKSDEETKVLYETINSKVENSRAEEAQ